jgi:DME family drug/metabolite transporter
MSDHTVTQHNSNRGVWQILLAAIFWGTVGITTQALYNLSSTNPLSIGFFRLGIGALILLAVCWRLLGRRIVKIKPRDALLMFLMGLMLAAYQACYFTAITYSGVAVASLVTICTTPVIVALVSITLARERITRTVGVALISALCGTVLLVFARSGAGILHASIIGILFALAAACGYASQILGGRLLTHHYHPLHINAVTFATGTVTLLILALSTRFVLSYPLQGWLLLLYLGSVPTAISYALFLIGMRTTSATITSIVTLVEPLTASLLAWLLFGEQLGPLGLLGGLLLVGAILLLMRKPRPLVAA